MSREIREHWARVAREAIAEARAKLHPELAEPPEPEPTEPEATDDE